MADWVVMGSWWARRCRLFGALALAGALAAVPGRALATAAPGSPAGTGVPTTTTTTTTLPGIPSVPLDVTDGQTPQGLLANALALTSLGVDGSALTTAIATAQVKLDAEAFAAQQAEAAASTADRQAESARAAEASAAAAYQSMFGAVKQAVQFLYADGPGSLSVSPEAGEMALYAQDYADSALGPYGVLATRRQTEQDLKKARDKARASQKLADDQSRAATKALGDEQAAADRLQAELVALKGASAAQVTADHVALASQVGTELLSANSLEFTPPTPLPPPVSTTAVALEWAFSELGKPYLWGATGPDSFDCSGLTQYVWNAAGVSIPRVAADQDAWAVPVPLSQLLPGDLVFFGTTDIHHVGIYIGGGLMINAPHTGDVVRVSSIWWSDLAGFGRVHSGTVPVPAHLPPSAAKPAKTVLRPGAIPVPSQPKPPPGWTPVPGSSTPISVSDGSQPAPSTTITTTTMPVTPSTTVDTTTTVPSPDPASTTTTTTASTTPTSVPGS